MKARAKKKTYSCIGVLLAVLMVFGAMPNVWVTASADNTKVTSVDLTVGKPYPGFKPNLNITVKGTGYQVDTSFNGSTRKNGVTWVDNTTNSIISNPDTYTYIEGHSYSVSVRVIVKSGYEFAASSDDNTSMTATVNSNKANIYHVVNTSVKNVVNIGYSFGECKKGVVSSANITGVTVPKPGQKPSYTTTTNSVYYHLADETNSYGRKNGVRWYDITTGNALTPDKDTFTAGHSYRFEAYFDAGTGFEFSTNSSGSTTLSVKVNSMAAKVIALSGSSPKDRVFVSYDFGECKNEVVSSISITGVTAPKVGGTPNYEATVNGGTFSINTGYTGSFVKNGIYWWDKTTNTRVNSSTGTFVSGHEYMIQVAVKANTGYEFSVNSKGDTTLKATVNGSSASVYGIVDMSDKEYVVVDYIFAPIYNEVVSTVALKGITEPKAGNKPSYPLFNMPSGYRIKTEANASSVRNGIYWWDKTDQKRLDPDKDVFTAGHVYNINIYVKANTGYEFATSTNGSSTVTAKINGNEANVVRIQNTAATDELCIYYTFPEAKNEVVSTVAVSGVTAPKSGAAPSYSAVVNDSKYKVYTDYSNMSGYSKGVRWWNVTDKTFVNPSTDKFHAGKQYKCEVLLLANTGYEFETDSSGYSKVTGTLNNNTASVIKLSSRDAKAVVCVEYKFKALSKEKISEVKVINLPEPKLGEAPSYLPSTVGAGYSIKKDYTSTSFKEGVRWVDLDGEGVIDHTAGYKFVEGHKYRCDIMLQVNDDYEFDSLGYIDAAINGREAVVSKMSGQDEKAVIVVDYTFEAMKPNIISTVAISGIDAPAAGKKPDYTAVVNGVGYEMATYAGTVWEVEKICWVNGTDIKYMQNMNGSEVVYDNFEAGKIYACTVLLKAKDGYTFAMNGSNTAVTATLNGNTAGVTTVNDVAPQNKYIQVTFNFGECPDNGSDDLNRIYGDVNNDGKITSADSLLILRASVNLESFDELTTILADVDENSKITSADSLEVLRYSVSLPSPTKVGQIYK